MCRCLHALAAQRFVWVFNGMELVGAVGIEPTTFGLKGRCSTTELRPYTLATFYMEESEHAASTCSASRCALAVAPRVNTEHLLMEGRTQAQKTFHVSDVLTCSDGC